MKRHTTDESRKAAQREANRRGYQKFKDRYDAGDPETIRKHKERTARWRGNHKEKVERIERSSTWRNKFGIIFKNDEELNRYLDASQNPNTKCIVTGMTNEEHLRTYGKKLPLDHDHTTGGPRGFVCDPINHALGILEGLTPEQQETFFSLVRAYRR